jgi:hypothetical protein
VGEKSQIVGVAKPLRVGEIKILQYLGADSIGFLFIDLWVDVVGFVDIL